MKRQYDTKEWATITPEVGKLIPWSQIVNKPLRVLSFDSNGTTVTNAGKVRAKSYTKPYGYLLVEQPGEAIYFKLPITHKVDFRLITSVYNHSDIQVESLEDRDIIVMYSPKSIRGNGLAKGAWHVLHFAITPAGRIEEFYLEDSNTNLEDLFGILNFTSNLGVHLDTNSTRFLQLKQTLEVIKGGTVQDQQKRIISAKLIDQARLYSTQKRELAEILNEYYPD